MYDYVWIPKTIGEMVFIINNNPHLFAEYFNILANEANPKLMIFYYNKRSREVESYDWDVSRISVGAMEYISRSVKNVTKTDLATFVSVFKNVKYKHIVKY